MITSEKLDQTGQFNNAVASIIKDTIIEIAKDNDFAFTEYTDSTKPYSYQLFGETHHVEFTEAEITLNVNLNPQELKANLRNVLLDGQYRLGYSNLVITPTKISSSGSQILARLFFGFHKVGPKEQVPVLSVASSKTPIYSSPLPVVPSHPELSTFSMTNEEEGVPSVYPQRIAGDVAPSCFSMAFNALKQNKRVQRQAWVPEDYLVLVSEIPNMVVCDNRPLAVSGIPVGTAFSYTSHIYMFRYDGPNSRLIPWSVSQEDILSNDWVVV